MPRIRKNAGDAMISVADVARAIAKAAVSAARSIVRTDHVTRPAGYLLSTTVVARIVIGLRQLRDKQRTRSPIAALS